MIPDGMRREELLRAASGGALDLEQVVEKALAQTYLFERLALLWQLNIEGVPPAEVFSAAWLSGSGLQ